MRDLFDCRLKKTKASTRKQTFILKMSTDDAQYAYITFSHVMGPLAAFSSIISGVAVITNYWYAQQRSFPTLC